MSGRRGAGWEAAVRRPSWPEEELADDLQAQREEVKKAITGTFGNHLVSLAIVSSPADGRPGNAAGVRNYSGFVLSIRGLWGLARSYQLKKSWIILF